MSYHEYEMRIANLEEGLREADAEIRELKIDLAEAVRLIKDVYFYNGYIESYDFEKLAVFLQNPEIKKLGEMG